ncbi:MAG: hypothetical protein OXG24_00570 [Gammaproteobacteria bacterium]|nr:hypothetical protein [Gammaproteobacteria bacterium]
MAYASSAGRTDAWYGPSYRAITTDLIESCPQPLEKLSAECARAVDDFFKNFAFQYLDVSWISIPNRLTYGRAFKNPQLDRSRVLEALQKKECRLEDGETVRWDLSESCHADAFANLSVFLWACNKHGGPANPSDYVVDMSIFAHREFSSPEYYMRILHRKIVRILEKHWVGDQCSRYELSQMRFDKLQDQAQWQLLHSTAERLGEFWRPSDVPEIYVLKSMAARLGDVSTAEIYNGPSSDGTKDDSWTKHMDKEWPWKFTLLWFDQYTFNSGNSHVDTVERLKMGISIATSLQKSGLEFDWNHLVRKVCTPEKPEETACKTAIEELDPTFEWHQEIELQVLEKFKSVSRKLNLYD